MSESPSQPGTDYREQLLGVYTFKKSVSQLFELYRGTKRKHINVKLTLHVKNYKHQDYITIYRFYLLCKYPSTAFSLLHPFQALVGTAVRKT